MPTLFGLMLKTASALILAVVAVACGSDDIGPFDERLTQPGSQPTCEPAAGAVEFSGTYTVDWACGGQRAAGGPLELTECDPTENPLLDADTLTIGAEAANGAHTVRLGALADVGTESGARLEIPPGTDGGQRRFNAAVTGCDDGSFILTMAWTTLDETQTAFWGADLVR